MRRKTISKDGVFISWSTLCFWLFISPPAALFIAYLMSTEAASQWFQAIGTLAAIGVAIWISNKESARRYYEMQCDAARRMRTSLVVGQAANSEFIKAIKIIETCHLTGQLGDNEFRSAQAEALNVILSSKVKPLQGVSVSDIADNEFAEGLFCYLYKMEVAVPLVCNYLIGYEFRDSLEHLKDWSVETSAEIKKMQTALKSYTDRHKINI